MEFVRCINKEKTNNKQLIIGKNIGQIILQDAREWMVKNMQKYIWMKEKKSTLEIYLQKTSKQYIDI